MFDLRRDSGWVLVLPDSKDPPSRAFQLSRGTAIALLVAFDLGMPVVGVAARPAVVLGATMPPATVNEYRRPSSGEDNVGRMSHSRYGAQPSPTRDESFRASTSSDSRLGLKTSMIVSRRGQLCTSESS